MGVQIVRMTEDHTEKLAELERLCFSHPWSREALEEELENPGACFLTAVEDGEILGYAGMHFAAGEFYVDNIAVFPSARKQGAGTALINALWEEVLRQKGEFLSLEVRPSNEAALALYRKLGFREEGRRKGFYSHPPEDGLILTKRKQEKSENTEGLKFSC